MCFLHTLLLLILLFLLLFVVKKCTNEIALTSHRHFTHRENIVKIRFLPVAERDKEISVSDSREKEETHARTSPAFMCPSKRGDTSTGLFVGFSRIPDVSAESFVPFARYAIEYFRDVFRLVSGSRIFIPLFLLDSITPFQSLSLFFFLYIAFNILILLYYSIL